MKGRKSCLKFQNDMSLMLGWAGLAAKENKWKLSLAPGLPHFSYLKKI